MDFPDLISMLSNIAVGVAAVVAAYVAWRGLSTWRDQLRGTVEYELARRMLKGAYRIRDNIAGVRNPFMFAAEMPDPPPEKAEGMSRDKIRYYGVSQAYQSRWNRVVEARRDLDTDVLEAEVLWGREIKTRLQTVRKLEHELWMATRYHLQLQDPDEDIATKDAIQKIFRKKRDVLYEGGDGNADQFADDYAAAIREVENYLRPHLRRTEA